MKDECIIVLISAPSEEDGAEIGKKIVEERLAACCNIVPAVRSLYWWKGELCDESEALCIFKTRAENFELIKARVVELHPYELPEIIAVDITDGLSPYLSWVIDESTAPHHPGEG